MNFLVFYRAFKNLLFIFATSFKNDVKIKISIKLEYLFLRVFQEITSNVYCHILMKTYA
jgi:hypothetical protein